MTNDPKQDKPHLVILPGWGGSHTTWADFIELAKTKFDVTIIDLPCFGDTPCPETVWGIEQYAQYVKSIISNPQSPTLRSGQAPISNRILLGHSFGGQVACYLAATEPELVDRLILVAPAIIRPKRLAWRLFFGTIAKTGKLIFRLPFIERFDLWAKRILYRVADSPDFSKTSGIKTEIYKKIIRQDLRHLLPQIKQKTLVIWGTKDRMTPISQASKIMALLPDAKFHSIKDGSHGLHHRHAEKLLASLLDFAL